MDKKSKNNARDKVFIRTNFIGIEKLGKGTYGSVYKVQRKDNLEYAAIKKIKLDVDTEGIPSTALREIAILKKINHSNVVNILDLALGEKKIELCLEFCPLDLRKFIDAYKDSSKIYNLDTLRTIMFQVMKGVDHLHSKKILHRDLKPQNILINPESLVVKVADFGLSRVFSIPIRPYTKEVLTLWYRAPELMLGSNQYSTGLDMWSVGCIFAELFMKRPLFAGDSEVDQLFKIYQCLGSPNENTLPGYKFFPDFNKDFPIWNGTGLKTYILEKTLVKMDSSAFDLFEKMILLDPCKRITAKEALNHAFFKDVYVPSKTK